MRGLAMKIRGPSARTYCMHRQEVLYELQCSCLSISSPFFARPDLVSTLHIYQCLAKFQHGCELTLRFAPGTTPEPSGKKSYTN